MFIANILCLIGGIVLGIITYDHVINHLCKRGQCQIKIFNPIKRRIVVFGSIKLDNFEQKDEEIVAKAAVSLYFALFTASLMK